jgi:DNA-binding MarR family transcriptional regulator
VAEHRARTSESRSKERPAPGSGGVARRSDRIPAERLNRLIHEKLRLGIVSALAVNDSLSFTDLKRLLRATDGNLSVHARKLETAGYVSCTKTFEDRLPRTTYRLTAAGRRALSTYLDHMEALIRSARR